MAPLVLNTAVAAGTAAGENLFDFVVAGAGHNSLITAAYLAKAGFSVVVLEGRPMIGGGCKTAEALMPGFKTDMCSSVHGFIQSNPLLRDNELNLRDYGLEYIDPDPIMHISFSDRSSITVWQDEDRTYEEYAKISKRDANTFRTLLAEWKAYRKARATGAPIPMENIWRRRLAMSSYDLVHELFESDKVRSFHLAVGRFSSVHGGDPQTGRFAFNVMTQQMNGRPMPVGGSGMLSESLGQVIRDHGGVILTNMPVVQLVVENGQCKGVECLDGSKFRARNGVVSTIHVKHLVDMAPKDLWGDEFLTGIDLIQPEHAMFAFHYALKEPPKFVLEDGSTISPSEAALMENPQKVLTSYLENEMGEFTIEGMPLQMVCPSIADPTRAPEGHHTMKILGNLPYELKEGPQHWDVIRDEVGEKVLNYFRRYTPNLTDDVILAKFLNTPLDIERWNPAMWKGSTHAFKAGPAQTGDMRPVPGWSNFRMPIQGLYQTGACTGAGGSIRGTPGRDAARVILKDFGTSLEEVVGKANA